MIDEDTGLDFNNISKIMLQMHKESFKYNPITKNEYVIDVSQAVKIFGDPKLTDNFVEVAEILYNKQSEKTESLTLDTKYWIRFFITYVVDALEHSLKHNKKEMNIKINNGCCTTNHCPFKLYFQQLSDLINNPDYFQQIISSMPSA